MPRLRKDINNAKILKMLGERHATVLSVASKLDCSTYVIRSARDGKRPTGVGKVKVINKTTCTHCGVRKKKKGHKYLCNTCYVNAETLYYDNAY